MTTKLQAFLGSAITQPINFFADLNVQLGSQTKNVQCTMRTQTHEL